ncbi:DUF4258 domain-containing protein [Kordia algicida OT-1]|uniref:DUF4258 domain-containing protein n=1 Tax=Kordia algicida OT-1 TaxID=391587 RepID=A9E0A4_9FLAO|nr:DUF4258 domain-containing protein [Kordia algicida]EDP95818.1 hypothetical protein KAOT1_05422 [Kordia algicida OT-1]
MNSGLLRRIGFYLGGVAIGLVIFAFLIRGRGVQCEFDYLPNARTLKNIRIKNRMFSPQIRQLIDNKEIDTAEISNILQYGDVDFSRSKTKVDSCKLYIIEGMLRNKEIELTVYNCDSTAIIQTINRID